MKEKIKVLKKDLFNKQGMISTYFLVLLYVVTLIIVVIFANAKNQSEAYINIEEANEYFIQENKVINDLRCKLEDPSLESGEESIDNVFYSYEVEESSITISISSPKREWLFITYDPTSKHLLDYSTLRPDASS